MKLSDLLAKYGWPIVLLATIFGVESLLNIVSIIAGFYT